MVSARCRLNGRERAPAQRVLVLGYSCSRCSVLAQAGRVGRFVQGSDGSGEYADSFAARQASRIPFSTDPIWIKLLCDCSRVPGSGQIRRSALVSGNSKPARAVQRSTGRAGIAPVVNRPNCLVTFLNAPTDGAVGLFGPCLLEFSHS